MESTAARMGAPAVRARTWALQSAAAVETALSMPWAASSATPASRRTRLTVWMPRERASMARVLPTAPLAVFWMIQSPSVTPRNSSSEMALKGMAISWAAASSPMASGTGARAPAGAMKASAQVPCTPATATRRPMRLASAPSPTASTTPTASLPPTAGNSGL
ncbi:hypothetical protein D3C85_1372820 [compost metagenome]